MYRVEKVVKTFKDLALPGSHGITFIKLEFYGRLCVEPCLYSKSALTELRHLRMKHPLCAPSDNAIVFCKQQGNFNL